MTNDIRFDVTLYGDGEFDYVARPQTFKWDGTTVTFASIRAIVADAETARAIAASFPKSLRVHGGELSGDPAGRTGYVSFSVSFNQTGVTGKSNEAGIKRLRSMLTRIAYDYKTSALNSLTREQFDAFVQTLL